MKRQSRMFYVVMAVLLVASFVLTACQTPTPAATSGPAATAAPTKMVITDKELNVLCTPQEEWCQGMKQEFEKKYGITVNYVRMSSGEVPGPHPG